MKIWVDADAWPGGIKNILFKADRRTKRELDPVGQPAHEDPAENFTLQTISGDACAMTVITAAAILPKGKQEGAGEFARHLY
ncbi:hypothetical protein [Desulfospira joergensenii]|uniref:hypothetical protein n=1 Tax=Desulfospira joergensenii TaxID=53329 RepID=UPI0003B73EFB|nr:hypothetical protein [Desulfospira joergensenii]